MMTKEKLSELALKVVNTRADYDATTAASAGIDKSDPEAQIAADIQMVMTLNAAAKATGEYHRALEHYIASHPDSEALAKEVSETVAASIAAVTAKGVGTVLGP